MAAVSLIEMVGICTASLRCLTAESGNGAGLLIDVTTGQGFVVNVLNNNTAISTIRAIKIKPSSFFTIGGVYGLNIQKG